MKRTLVALLVLAPLAACNDASTRVSYTVVTGATHDCARAPNASFDASNGTVAFTGTCERIRVIGGNNKITIAAAKAVEVTGGNNVVEVEATDNLKATGPGNTIRFRKGLTVSKPSIVTTGDNSPIVQMN